MWSVPMPVLNSRDVGHGGKQGKRDGFNIYNRLGCKACKTTFHKVSGHRAHFCKGSTSRSSLARPASYSSSYSTPRASQPQKSFSLGTRRSSRMISSTPKYRDDDIEIVCDTEEERKAFKKLDEKNFSELTLKGQREAMEAFFGSGSTEFEEDDEVEVKPVRNTRASRRKWSKSSSKDDDDDSDIEFLILPKKKKKLTNPNLQKISRQRMWMSRRMRTVIMRSWTRLRNYKSVKMLSSSN